MESKIVAWGNSLAVRIPAAVAEQIGVYKNSSVVLEVEGNVLTIKPIESRRRGRERRPMSYYLAQLQTDAKDAETSTGPARGREEIE